VLNCLKRREKIKGIAGKKKQKPEDAAATAIVEKGGGGKRGLRETC